MKGSAYSSVITKGARKPFVLYIMFSYDLWLCGLKFGHLHKLKPSTVLAFCDAFHTMLFVAALNTLPKLVHGFLQAPLPTEY